jgi:hypothetical protein
MNLPCLDVPICHSGDYESHQSCACNVPHYCRYLYSNHFLIHAFNHQERADLSQVVCGQYRLNQLNPSSNPNQTQKLNLKYFSLSRGQFDVFSLIADLAPCVNRTRLNPTLPFSLIPSEPSCNLVVYPISLVSDLAAGFALSRPTQRTI